MAVIRSALALFAWFAVLTSGCRELPSSAETLLLRRLPAKKIIKVHEVRRRTIGDFDYLGLFATFEVTMGWESWYHREIILRKRHTDSDWSSAELFSSAQRIEPLFALPDADFTKALNPWPSPKPKSMKPTPTAFASRLVPLRNNFSVFATAPAVAYVFLVGCSLVVLSHRWRV